MPFALNTEFDFDGYVSRFAGKGRVRLEGALAEADALAVHQTLERQTPWELQLVSAEGRPEVLSRHELDMLSPDIIQTRLQDAATRAQTGLAYLRLGLDLMSHTEPGLRDVSDLLKSDAFAQFCGQLTGLSGLVLTQLEAVCYRNGDFFTRHTDASARLCFEWNFTQGWRSDWGGQVLFHAPSGDIEGGIMPRMNDLALYAGDQPRSIASVAPYAGGPRFSISGRFA
ncbi:2OG-Fe(II) oxygenase family protein [Asticcacaulis sp. EMRT-3]|uniref:2OG-Fe(II) oxygenase family protein n=1 Tax=Asticcacaulis sp. EMRT-3 TaxID=3040349 RepID=UPI0024AF6444|nr:2OG-Fe(II) oxygenase family protein [Asticcacaulis sp. EMRT-3]MDI7774113.1 2OG-Fe(II) oxygenase family protein [Asticcacaulis sp. EMRT-3]